MNFVCVDFETANSQKNSICEIGIVVVKDGEIDEKISYLVRPQISYFKVRNVKAHGIKPEMVEFKPEFNDIWGEIEMYFNKTMVFAHNASFDISVLRAALDLYELKTPDFDFLCSYRIAQRAWKGFDSYRLQDICESMGIEIDLHNAASDAHGCAKMMIKLMKDFKFENYEELCEEFQIQMGKVSPEIYIPTKLIPRKKIIPKSKIKIDPKKLDPNHPFYGKKILIGGKLVNISRKDAQKHIKEVGGVCLNQLSNDTDFMVISQQYLEEQKEVVRKFKKKKFEIPPLPTGEGLKYITEEQFLKNLKWRAKTDEEE